MAPYSSRGAVSSSPGQYAIARTDRPRTGVSKRHSSRPVSGSSATTPPFCSVMYMMLLMTTAVFCHFRPGVLVSNSQVLVSRVTFCGVICVSVEKRA